jgi:DNA-binding LytR/AlgR family response regulator
MSRPAPTALIAEDEPLLAAALKAELALAWPELQIVALVGDGHSAVAQALELKPDVLFFDIQMPGQSGLDAALELADEWPEPGAAADSGKPFPALVFVTAYDQYAVQAFEAQAVDYLLKPINQSRLIKTVNKLASSHGNIEHIAPIFDDIISKLRTISESKPKLNETLLSVIQASVGNTIHMVKVSDVAFFEAADKYVRVLTRPAHGKAGRDYLIRMPLKELLPQLDPAAFWQVHRGTVVRAECIELVSRDEAGKLWLTLESVAQKVAVSRLYAHQFKAM